MTILARAISHPHFSGLCPILCAKRLETLQQNTLLGAQPSPAPSPLRFSCISKRSHSIQADSEELHNCREQNMCLVPYPYFQQKLPLGTIPIQLSPHPAQTDPCFYPASRHNSAAPAPVNLLLGLCREEASDKTSSIPNPLTSPV